MILLTLSPTPLHLVMLFRFEEFTMVHMVLSSSQTLFLSLLQCCLDWKKTKGPSCPCPLPQTLLLARYVQIWSKNKRPKFSCSPPSSLPHAVLFRLGENKGRSFSSNPLSLSLPLACIVVKIWRKLMSFMSLSSAPHTKTLSLPLVMLLVLFLP